MEQLLGRFYGHEVAVSPVDALLLGVRLAAGRVAIAAGKMQSAEPDSKAMMYYTQLHVQAVDQMVRYSKIALDAGVAERLVNIAEREGRQSAEMFERILDEIHLTEDQRAALPEAIERVLRPLEQDYLLPKPVTVIDGNARPSHSSSSTARADA